MNQSPAKSRTRIFGFLAALVGLFALFLSASARSVAPGTRTAANKYIGAEKCKSCHDAEEKGNQYGSWETQDHAKAYERLASEEALAIAKEKGIEDPQKADECLRCHTTGHGVEASLIKRGFKMERGVQCESCHGPGDLHKKERFKAAAAEKPDEPMKPGEIVAKPGQDVCLGCHNHESPTFKPFCYYKRMEKIRHMHPLTEEESNALLVCGCGDACACTDGCPDDGCAVPKGSLK